MDKDSKKSKTHDVEKRKRQNPSKKDDKKGRGKQRKKDISVENHAESKQTKETEKESDAASTSRPPSPDPNCSICLGDLQNKSFTDSCFHMFCFVCLKEWSKVKAECPLCKQKFKNIIYNVKSYQKYDTYSIEEETNRNQWDNDGTRFRYRTTLTFERRLTIGPEHNYSQFDIARPSNLTTRAHWRRYREPATSEFRRRVYSNGLRAVEITDRRLRTRDTTPAFYRRNPAQIHRLVPWLNRELNSLLQNQPDHVQLVMEIIMGLIKTYPIDSEEFYQHVYPYVGRHTRHFMHEFLCFAKSPYNMTVYDSHVSYHQGALVVDTDSNDSLTDIGDGDDDFVEEIIDVEDRTSNDREPHVERRRNNPSGDLTDLRPLFQSVRDILETESPGSSLNLPLSMSGWDSPTPGPSWMSLADDPDLSLVSSAAGNVPVVGNRESSPIDIASSSDSDSDSTLSDGSNGSDIVFVRVEKPWEERSPIMLSSEDEGKLFADKHYSKKKNHQKKREHKKHKKHKDSYDREQSKERHKHKKHKRHHSSDKSSRRSHSSSKHSDSVSSRSSSKHRENEQSSSKPSEADNSTTSSSSSAKHKKHKKHKHEDYSSKSKSSKKLQSVIVLPNSANNKVQSGTSRPVSTEHLFPSVTSQLLSSTSNVSASLDTKFKKHSSGHKKSGKLIDIVPKLLEKGLDKLISDSKKNEIALENRSSGTIYTQSLSFSGCNSSQEFFPFDLSNANKKNANSQQKNMSTSTVANAATGPICNSDSILSLENSRRCLKCRLLYIPELLDKYDICVTCKKKKVCETESRSFSDVLNQISRNRTSESISTNTSQASNSATSATNQAIQTLGRSGDNVVIQEGNETSLRPVLNQVDLTNIDAPLLDTTESDTDDCELVLSKTTRDNFPVGIDSTCSSNILDLSSISQSPMKTLSQESNPLRIDFSNPPTPSKQSQPGTSLLGSQSPPPWRLEVSNPPTPSSNDWPGYMAPRSPNFAPQFPSLESYFPTSVPYCFSLPNSQFQTASSGNSAYSNINLMSSYSPMNYSSLFFNSLRQKYSPSKEVLIDLENESVDLYQDDNCKSKGVTNMSVCSTQSICLSDSEDSGKSVDLFDEEKLLSTHVDEERNVTNNLDEILKNNESNLNCEKEKQIGNDEMDTSNEQNETDKVCKQDTSGAILRNDEFISRHEDVNQDIDMLSTSQWDNDNSVTQQSDNSFLTFKNSVKNDGVEPVKHDIVYDSTTNASDSASTCSVGKLVPRSLEQKLSGLTDFSPSVLRSINKENGLSFHSIISSQKHNVSLDNIPDSTEREQAEAVGCSNEKQSNELPLNLVDNFSSSNSVFVSSSSPHVDSLVGNLNENSYSMDRFDVETTRPNSVSMNSIVSGQNIFSENAILKSPVSMAMDTENMDMICDSTIRQPLPISFSSCTFGKSGCGHISDRPTVISPLENVELLSSSTGDQKLKSAIDNQVSSSDVHFDSDESLDNTAQLTINDDHQDSSDGPETNVTSHDFDTTDSEVENCFFKDSEDESSTVAFRVDILHSKKQLSENLSNVFDSSSDSN